MADVALSFLLRSLQQLLIQYLKQIEKVKTQIINLDTDLRFFKGIHEDFITAKRSSSKGFREHVRDINEAIHDAEDIIEDLVTKAALIKSQNSFLGPISNKINLHGMAEKVDSIIIRFQLLRAKNTTINSETPNIRDDAPEEKPKVPPDVPGVVGFEEDEKTIIGYLTEKTVQLDVISIIGMPGVGKTTLAAKIFHDEGIKKEFPTTRVWIHVLSENSGDLGDEIISHLGKEKDKFLIVIDNVSTKEDWDRIKRALPKNNAAGKVLITSPDEKVARYANQHRSPHKLQPLTREKSLFLLLSKVFGKPPDNTTRDFEDWGRLIVKHCDGLPLAIVGIGDILVTKYSALDDLSTKKAEWERMSKRNNNNQYQEELRQGVGKVFARSYNSLPYHLRACFLYLGMFPKNFEISVRKLIYMWIAERFIQKDGISLEEKAEDYLVELVNRSLVKVEKRRRDGRPKTCRIHNMIRLFCINEAAPDKDNFLREIERTIEGSAQDFDAVRKCRRICIHSSVLNFISSMPTNRSSDGSSVRSFVCFSDENLTLQNKDTATIPAAFNLLRVLEAIPLEFKKIPSEMYILLHLRYISLSFNLADLPASFAKLWNLETLIANTTSQTLAIKADIWKLTKLRHLITNASASLLPKAGKSAAGGEDLRTLGMISPQSCTKEVLDRCPKLKKLNIRGKLTILLEGKTVSIDAFEKLVKLEKMKLLNDVSSGAPSVVPMPHLPPYLFPPSLKRVTLSATFLNWNKISTLGLLENLKVLKLKDKAFVGDKWEATEGHFQCLEFLHIGLTDLTIWKASQKHYPKLECLELDKCEELQQVPIDLAYIPNFRKLTVSNCRHATDSAKDIRDAKEKKWEQENIKDRKFNLSISSD